jgi:hypothetical protein
MTAQAKPIWYWNGVAALVCDSGNPRLRDLLTMLPTTRSNPDEIVAQLGELGARYQRWLHQDEFGPTRQQQTATIRALMTAVQKLQRHFAKCAPSLRSRFEMHLHDGNNPSNTVLEALFEAAVDLEHSFRKGGAPNFHLTWARQLRDFIELLMVSSQAVDTNADGEIFCIAIKRNFDLSSLTGINFEFAEAERWLSDYWNVLLEAFATLGESGGADERVSLKLLIEQLCELWERETQSPVTAHGIEEDAYTSRPVTAAGRFVATSVEAMLPNASWFADHAAQSVRAMTFLPIHQADRERQILGIMRDFVRRRQKFATEVAVLKK